jgi:hypothetical protein
MAVGVSFTTKPKHALFLSFALGVPIAKLSVSSNEPAASLNGYGFSDLFVQPLRAGWRAARYDFVTAYMVYAPTGRFEPRGGGVGRGYWTHQLSLGGAAYFDTTRTSRASVLASYDMNTRKRGVDVRRGNMFQLQGGAGVAVRRIVMFGAAGYALWQVGPDRGIDIPPSLKGQRSRTFALGPEVDVTFPALRIRADARYEHEFGVTSRPRGHVIAIGVSYLAAK